MKTTDSNQILKINNLGNYESWCDEWGKTAKRLHRFSKYRIKKKVNLKLPHL